MDLYTICQELGVEVKNYKKEKSIYPKALKGFWQHPTLREDIWYHIFDTDPVITIPMYLAYIEGWSARRFERDVGITPPTYTRWITSITIPARNRLTLINAMNSIESPLNPELYEEALSNDEQWLVSSRAKTYKPSKELFDKVKRDMGKNHKVDAADYPSKNKLRLRYQITYIAKVHGWREVNPGLWIDPKNRKLSFKTIAD